MIVENIIYKKSHDLAGAFLDLWKLHPCFLVGKVWICEILGQVFLQPAASVL